MKKYLRVLILLLTISLALAPLNSVFNHQLVGGLHALVSDGACIATASPLDGMRQFETLNDERGGDVTINAWRDVLVVGSLSGLRVQRESGEPFGCDVCLRTYDRNDSEDGTPQWGTPADEDGRDITVDATDPLLIVGETGAAFPGQRPSGGREGVVQTLCQPRSPVGDAYEPDDSYATSSSLEIAPEWQSQARSINPIGDIDVISFRGVDHGRDVAIWPGVYTFYSTGSTDTYIDILDPVRSQPVASDDNSGAGGNFWVEYLIPGSGGGPTRDFFIAIRGARNDTQGTYTVWYRYVPLYTCDAYESDDCFADARPITMTTSWQCQARTAWPILNDDYIAFRVTEAGTYQFCLKTEITVLVQVFDACYTPLTEAYTGGPLPTYGGTTVIEYVITSPGTYVIRIMGWGDQYGGYETGPYTLSYRYEPADTPSC